MSLYKKDSSIMEAYFESLKNQKYKVLEFSILL